ncbi:hypothetical protein D3C77_355150 [compost metagenome]
MRHFIRCHDTLTINKQGEACWNTFVIGLIAILSRVLPYDREISIMITYIIDCKMIIIHTYRPKFNFVIRTWL